HLAPHSFPTRRSSDLLKRSQHLDSFGSCRGIAGFQRPLRMAEEVYPSTLFDSSVVGPDHRFVIRRRILKFSGVDHRPDTNHAFRSEEHTSELQSRFDL